MNRPVNNVTMLFYSSPCVMIVDARGLVGGNQSILHIELSAPLKRRHTITQKHSCKGKLNNTIREIIIIDLYFVHLLNITQTCVHVSHGTLKYRTTVKNIDNSSLKIYHKQRISSPSGDACFSH